MVTDARRAIVEGHAALGIELEPNAPGAAGFDAFIQRFVDAPPVERAAVDHTDTASSSGSAAAATR